MTTKELQKYADKKLPNYVHFDVNKARFIRPWAEEGEKYTIYYRNTYKAIAHANTIDEAILMINDYCNRL